MTNTQELPITEENLANLKVGDEILVGISKDKAHWVEVYNVSYSVINEFAYYGILDGVYRYYTHATTPLDIHAIRKALVIPEGWTKYDPNVLPPEDAEEIEMVHDDNNESLIDTARFFTARWATHNNDKKIKRIMYRVTKWQTKTAAQQLAECLCGEYSEKELTEKLEAFAKEIRG